MYRRSTLIPCFCAVPLEVLFHCPVELGSARFVEGRPEGERRAVVVAEDLPHLAGVLALVAGVELLEREREGVAQHRLDIGLVTPLER